MKVPLRKRKENNTNTDKSQQWEYTATMLLKYIENNSSEFDFCRTKHFGSDINISKNKILLSKLLKSGYIRKNENISIISTVEGRKFISEGTLLLTEKGRIFLSEHEDFTEFYNFKMSYAGFCDYQRIKRQQKNKAESFEAVMIMLLLRKINERKKDDDYIGVKELHFTVGELYEKISYKPQAMHHYLISLYYDVSGLEYYDNFLEYIEDKETEVRLKETYKGIHIDSQTIANINKNKDVYHDDMVDSIYEKNPISINLCTRANFKKLIFDILNDGFEYDKWQETFSEAFNRMIEVAKNYKK